jgi:hypothetical protein
MRVTLGRSAHCTDVRVYVHVWQRQERFEPPRGRIAGEAS